MLCWLRIYSKDHIQRDRRSIIEAAVWHVTWTLLSLPKSWLLTSTVSPTARLNLPLPWGVFQLSGGKKKKEPSPSVVLIQHVRGVETGLCRAPECQMPNTCIKERKKREAPMMIGFIKSVCVPCHHSPVIDLLWRVLLPCVTLINYGCAERLTGCLLLWETHRE